MAGIAMAVETFRAEGGRVWLDTDGTIKVFGGFSSEQEFNDLRDQIKTDRAGVVRYLNTTCTYCYKTADVLYTDDVDAQARYCKKCLQKVAKKRFPLTDTIGRNKASLFFPPCSHDDGGCGGPIEYMGPGRLYCSNCCIAWAPSGPTAHINKPSNRKALK